MSIKQHNFQHLTYLKFTEHWSKKAIYQKFVFNKQFSFLLLLLKKNKTDLQKMIYRLSIILYYNNNEL